MQTVVITGGNSGLGYYCAQEIASDRNWQVIIACRNIEKATQAVAKLKATVKSDRIDTMFLDLASFDQRSEQAPSF